MAKVFHGSEVVHLRGPGAQELALKGDDAAAAALTPPALNGGVVFAWEPEGGEDDEHRSAVEVRARIVSSDGLIGDIPVVRWSIEVTELDAVWKEPMPAADLVAGTTMLDYSLPARGMAWRVPVSQFRIAFRNQGMLASATPLLKSTIKVTVLPVWGGFEDRYPYTYLAFPVAGVQHPFPMTAREWRLVDSEGVPFAAGSGIVILFVGILGALFGASAAEDYADFQPIPHDAVAFGTDSPVYAAYR